MRRVDFFMHRISVTCYLVEWEYYVSPLASCPPARTLATKYGAWSYVRLTSEPPASLPLAELTTWLTSIGLIWHELWIDWNCEKRCTSWQARPKPSPLPALRFTYRPAVIKHWSVITLSQLFYLGIFFYSYWT